MSCSRLRRAEKTPWISMAPTRYLKLCIQDTIFFVPNCSNRTRCTDAFPALHLFLALVADSATPACSSVLCLGLRMLRPWPRAASRRNPRSLASPGWPQSMPKLKPMTTSSRLLKMMSVQQMSDDSIFKSGAALELDVLSARIGRQEHGMHQRMTNKDRRTQF